MTVQGALDGARFRALTFDCYGTLIDWHGGIRGAVRAMPSLAGADHERLLVDRERIDFELIQGEYLPYPEILRRSMAEAARLQGREPSPGELDAFAASMASWKPFDESPGCLERLGARFRFCILSNVDNRTLRASVAQLGAPFELVTAEDLRAYKPARNHFDAGLQRLGLAREEVLHVAGSLLHDHAPAQALGWTSVWVNRLGEPPGAAITPNVVVANLTELCQQLDV